jgi:hypothetical protein
MNIRCNSENTGIPRNGQGFQIKQNNDNYCMFRRDSISQATNEED